MSPSLGIGIGMGYVKSGHEKPGNVVEIGIRDKKLKAAVVKLPFFKSRLA